MPKLDINSRSGSEAVTAEYIQLLMNDIKFVLNNKLDEDNVFSEDNKINLNPETMVKGLAHASNPIYSSKFLSSINTEISPSGLFNEIATAAKGNTELTVLKKEVSVLINSEGAVVSKDNSDAISRKNIVEIEKPVSYRMAKEAWKTKFKEQYLTDGVWEDINPTYIISTNIDGLPVFADVFFDSHQNNGLCGGSLSFVEELEDKFIFMLNLEVSDIDKTEEFLTLWCNISVLCEVVR